MTASPAVVATLRDLVAFDTTSSDSNLALIEYLEQRLAGPSVRMRRFPSPEGDKANLLVTIGPDGSDGTILSGHTDCVPVTGQAWHTDPFILTRNDDRWHGRGTADMKGFLACVVAVADDLDGHRLARPLHLAFSYDEEVGGPGAALMLDQLRGEGFTARHCLVGEPTSLQVVNGHKGIYVYEARVQGSPAHSSLAPSAVNAVEYASRLIGVIVDLASRRRIEGPFDEAYDVEHTTINVGNISGGGAVNIVPERCELAFEFRHLPEDPANAIIAAIESEAERLTTEMTAIVAGAGITLRQIAHMPPLATRPDADVVGWATNHAARTDLAKVAYGTEAGLFVDLLGVPAVVCGPGSIRNAHRPDEFVTDDQLAGCEVLLRSIVGELVA